MSNNRLIEALIFEPLTASELADILRSNWSEVIEVLQELSLQGLVRAGFNQVEGDMICVTCGEEDQGDEAEPGFDCIHRGEGETGCPGWVVDNCWWVYCGGPISRALSGEEVMLCT